MKLLNKLIILSLIFISTLFADHISLNSEEKEFIKNNPVIKVGAESDWPPFDFVENGKYKGLAKDYLDLVEHKTGLKFNYIVDSWDNLLQRTKNKDLDLLPILAKTQDREKFLLYTNKYLTVRDYIFSSDSSIISLDNLKDKTAAVPKGYVQEEFLRKNYPEIKIHTVDGLLEAMDAIITKKADFLISNIAIMNYLIKKHNISQIRATANLNYSGNDLHMAVRNDSTVLRNIIQKALDDISLEERNLISSKWLSQNQSTLNSNLVLSEEELAYLKNKKSIIIANEYDWYPFDFYENNLPKGYVIDYVKLVTKKLGLETIFVTDKWGSLVKRFKNKEIDVLPVISYNKKREEFLSYTNSFMKQQLSIITKESTNDIINIDDMKDKKLAMIKDWNITRILKKHYPKINIIEFESIKDVFDAINNNFVDATIQNKLLASYYINQNYLGRLKIGTDITLPTHSNKLYMALQKEESTLINLFNKAISSISQKELESLENKWISFGTEINFTKEELAFIENTTIKAIGTDNWGPFNFTEKDKLKGISVDIFEYIKDKANLKTNVISSKKFINALNSIEEKENDIILATSKTKDREEYAIFSDIMLTTPIGIATLQDKNYISSAKDLLGKRIAVGKNFSAHKLLEERYPDMNFVFVYNVEQGLEYLSQNQVYAYVDIMPVLTYNIEKFGFTNIKVSGQTGIDFDLRIMIRDDYHLLQSIINKTLNTMPLKLKQEINDKWLKVKFESSVDYSLIAKVVAVLLIIILFVLYKNRQLQDYQKKLVKTKKELESSLKNIETLIDLNIAGVLIVNNRKIIYLNDETINIFGFEKKRNLIHKPASEILLTNEQTDIFKLLESIESSHEFIGRKSDGTLFPILVKSKKVVFDNKPANIISIIDLTDIKNKEELIFQQSKMASLGEMIGNIAHQWRQPLSSISTAASGMKVQKEFGQLTDESFDQNIERITETTKFLSQTIDDFRNYIKDNKVKKEFNVSTSIEKVLLIMKGTFTNHFINIHKDCKDIKINGYENELTQVLLNILSNSKDALKNINEDDRNIFIKTYERNSNLIVELVDTAGGISTNIIDKVFEPYFTTKHQSQGTGLGLYMTHKIVTESMDGEIKIENCTYKEFDKCTKVTLIIPT